MNTSKDQNWFLEKMIILILEGTNTEIQRFLHSHSGYYLTTQTTTRVSKFIANQSNAAELAGFFAVAGIHAITNDSIFTQLLENCWQLLESNYSQNSSGRRGRVRVANFRVGNLVRFTIGKNLVHHLPEVAKVLFAAIEDDLNMNPNLTESHFVFYVELLQSAFSKSFSTELTAEAMTGVAL